MPATSHQVSSDPTDFSTSGSGTESIPNIERAAINAPSDDRIAITYQPRELRELNLLDAGISTIIWATGYALDYQWIGAPILDEMAYPRQERGVAHIPGLFFLGLLWQHSQASASLVGPEFDGPYLVERMALASV